MTRSARARLAATVPHVPGTSRRAQFSATTRRALVDVAERLFTEHGYAATSLDAIVAGADVTKGALYHHYSGKQALFEAVFEKVESAGAQQIQEALTGARGPVGQGDRRAPGVPRRGAAAVVQPDRHPGRPVGAGLRAVPRAGGALDVRLRPRHRAGGAGRRRLARRRRAGAHLRPDLLRRDVVVGGAACRPPTTPTPRPSGWSWRSASSCRACARWPTRACRCRRRLGGLLLEGDVAAVDRDQLDPRVTGGHRRAGALLRGQLDRRRRPCPCASSRRPSGRCGRAGRCPCRSAASRARGCRPGRGSRRRPPHPQHQHVRGRELVAGGRVAVEVVVAAVGELPLGGVAARELGADRGRLDALGQVACRCPRCR